MKDNESEEFGIQDSATANGGHYVPGDVVAGRFEVVRPLREGCQGSIYLVRHVDFPERLIAMKVLLMDQDEDPEITAARFRNEVMAAYSVTHPNVVRVFDYVREGDIVAFTMEYVIGGDLADLLAYDEPLNINQVVHILQQVCQGVESIHKAGIIHRDLKPENILITKEGEVKISDFGTARKGTTLGRKGGITGTVAYLSPEYLKDGHLDFRSDLYSLGVVAFEMIAGQTPFKGESLMETLTMRLHEPAPPVKDFNPKCPASLDAIVQRLLATHPEDRYQSIDEVMSDLKKVRVRGNTTIQSLRGSKIIEMLGNKPGTEDTAALETSSPTELEASRDTELVAENNIFDLHSAPLSTGEIKPPWFSRKRMLLMLLGAVLSSLGLYYSLPLPANFSFDLSLDLPKKYLSELFQDKKSTSIPKIKAGAKAGARDVNNRVTTTRKTKPNPWTASKPQAKSKPESKPWLIQKPKATVPKTTKPVVAVKPKLDPVTKPVTEPKFENKPWLTQKPVSKPAGQTKVEPKVEEKPWLIKKPVSKPITKEPVKKLPVVEKPSVSSTQKSFTEAKRNVQRSGPLAASKTEDGEVVSATLYPAGEAPKN